MGRIKFALFLLFTMGVSRISAGPMYTEFSEMIKNSRYIFIGTFTGFEGGNQNNAHHYNFTVDQILKGDPNTKIKLGRSESGGFYGMAGNKYVVFVNKKDQFEWMGFITGQADISDNTVLSLQGFCDWNAHIVSPGNISLGQLKQYINTGSYSGKVHGPVNFFSAASKKMETSPIYIEADYIYKDSLTWNVSVNGIGLNDFNKKPDFYLPSFYDRRIGIQYNRNIYRSLSFDGEINDEQVNGYDWEVNFYVSAPEEISYEDFKKYMNDATLPPPYFNLVLTTEDNKAYPISFHNSFETILSMDGKDLENMGMQLAPKRILTFGKQPYQVEMIMDSCVVPRSQLEGLSIHHLLIRELLYGPITGTLKKDAKEIKCTLSYESSSFKRE
jgi:hypothetical protein